MRKYLAFSVVASTLLMAGGDIAPVEPVVAVEAAEVDYGKVFGQFRTFYVDRTYSGTVNNNRNALAMGGYIGYKTPDFNGLTAAVAAYGTYGFEIHDLSIEDDLANNWASYDPTHTGRDGENYAFIGQAYLNYAVGNTNIQVGRQRLDTPLIGADDARMLPNLFEAAVLTHTDIEDTTLILAHVTRETTGTFSNIYDDGTDLGFASGYGAGTTLAQSGDFVNMGTVALGEGNNTNGVTAASVIYKGFDGLTLTAWDYYAHDIMNTVYLQADYGWTCLLNENVKMNASAQYIGQSDVGDALAGNVDANYYGAKLAASSGALSGYIAYSTTDSDTDNILTGNGNLGIITPWGGMPAFTQGMVARYQFFSDTDSWKVAGTYKLNELLGADVKASVFYTEFDIGATNSYDYGTAWTASESGWDIQYNVASVEGLNLRARANYPRDFKNGLDWDEYRLIVNYNF